MKQIIRDAHSELQFVIASLDARLQEFIVKQTRYDEVIDPETAIALKLDWDMAKWRAPVVDAEGYTDRATRSLGLVGFGALALGPIIETTLGHRLIKPEPNSD